jgi:MFS family permease
MVGKDRRMLRAAFAGSRHWRLPFFYGWVIVAVVFVTMGIAVNARTAFSLLFPPILDEFGWDRGLTAGAFSFGFLVSAGFAPTLGRLMDRRGPRVVIVSGVGLMALGMFLATLTSRPWHLYATLGVLVGGGSISIGYSGQSLFLPNWFVRRRGLAMSLAFSGVGIGSIILLPCVELLIEHAGWRAACAVMGGLLLGFVVPLNFLLRHRPEELGLMPDGGAASQGGGAAFNIVDPVWAAIDWTLPRALRTARFWWVALGFFCSLFAWYAVQVHQTKYLVEIGFDPYTAAWALGLVSLLAIPGQIALGHISDRVGREWVWTAGCLGFAVCYIALLVMPYAPSPALLYVMVAAQGALGYGLTSVLGAIPAEIFLGRHFGAIAGALMLPSMLGGAVGPWLSGVLHDMTGGYALAFAIAIGCCVLSAVAMWRAAPRKVRAVAGRVARPRRESEPSPDR